jgi:hypothetical protein
MEKTNNNNWRRQLQKLINKMIIILHNNDIVQEDREHLEKFIDNLYLLYELCVINISFNKDNTPLFDLIDEQLNDFEKL